MTNGMTKENNWFQQSANNTRTHEMYLQSILGELAHLAGDTVFLALSCATKTATSIFKALRGSRFIRRRE